MLTDHDKKAILEHFKEWSGSDLKKTPFDEIDAYLQDGLPAEYDEKEVRKWMNSLFQATASARWMRQEDGVWVYGDEQNSKVWVELQKKGNEFVWEVTDGKNTHASGSETLLQKAQEAAQQSYRACAKIL